MPKIDLVKEIVEANGDSIGMNQPVCVIHKADHENCSGCPSELGCSKLVRLKGLYLTPFLYTPSSFQDFQDMQNRIEDLADKILKSKTPEELKTLPLR